MNFHPQTLTVGLSDPATVQALHVRVYVAPHTPTGTPTNERVFTLAPFASVNTLALGNSGIFDGLEGYHVDISVSSIGTNGVESSEVFADNNGVIVSLVVQQPPTGVHAND
jgi:hypothetical protein